MHAVPSLEGKLTAASNALTASIPAMSTAVNAEATTRCANARRNARPAWESGAGGPPNRARRIPEIRVARGTWPSHAHRRPLDHQGSHLITRARAHDVKGEIALQSAPFWAAFVKLHTFGECPIEGRGIAWKIESRFDLRQGGRRD